MAGSGTSAALQCHCQHSLRLCFFPYSSTGTERTGILLPPTLGAVIPLIVPIGRPIADRQAIQSPRCVVVGGGKNRLLLGFPLAARPNHDPSYSQHP